MAQVSVSPVRPQGRIHIAEGDHRPSSSQARLSSGDPALGEGTGRAVSMPHTGQRDPPPAPGPSPEAKASPAGWWEEADRPLAGAGGTGRDVGLLVSRKGGDGRGEGRAWPGDPGRDSVSQPPAARPRAAVERSALEGRAGDTNRLLTQHWESPPPGESVHHYPCPRHALDSWGDP